LKKRKPLQCDPVIALAAAASGKELLHVDGDFHRFPTAIAPDGSSVAVVRQREKGVAQIVVFDVESGRERRSISLPPGSFSGTI
jgi:hypothetical protein